MPSIIPGFEYDIFISYRQKDNKGDHWVTEFVKALQTELDATFKEEVTIYYDENPHDGLLENHDVDKTLERKLRSLLFIPILSQTYCDPKSFAWENEFCAFNKLVKEDSYGRDIKLRNGNIASRILPVRIHDLETEDLTLIQGELNGPLRAIDFIFKSPGVNRPLRPNEDHSQDNQNKTFYRDQINKVANAVKEIITSMKNPSSVLTQPVFMEAVTTGPGFAKRKSFLFSALALVLIAAGYFIYPRFSSHRPNRAIENSIAVLPFKNMSNDPEQEWFSDGMTRQINTNLGKLKILKVIGITSVMHYKGTTRTIQEIAKELNHVSYVLEGSVQKSGNKIKVNAQLMRASDGYQLWGEDYDRDLTDIFSLQDELSEQIAEELLGELLPDQKQLIKTDQPASVEAYEYYMKGLSTHLDLFASSLTKQDFQLSEQMFMKAISLDPMYARSYGALADLYDTYSWTLIDNDDHYSNNNNESTSTFKHKRDSVVRIGFRLNPHDPYVLLVMSFIPYSREPFDLDSTFYYLRKAYEINPEDPIINREIANIFNQIGFYDQAQDVLKKVLWVDPVNARARYLLSMGQIYAGHIDLAEENLLKALEISNDNVRVNYLLGLISIFYKKDLSEAQARYQNMVRINPENMFTKAMQSCLLAKQGKKQESLRMGKNIATFSILNMKEEGIRMTDSLTRQLFLDVMPYPKMLTDKRLDYIRNEPDFKKILAREKKVFEDRLAKYGSLIK
jgi:TolB-like protein/Tfp pilus assembly protein PilF